MLTFDVEYINPFNGRLEKKRIRGNYADGLALTKAEEIYRDYHRQVTVKGLEIKTGQRIPRFTFRGIGEE